MSHRDKHIEIQGKPAREEGGYVLHDFEEYLLKHGIDLKRLNVSTASDLSDEVIELLSKQEGELDLSGLKKISDAAAEFLSRYPVGLSLNGLTELSDAADECFSKHEGVLNLESLTSLTPAAAAALAKKNGTINKRKPVEWAASLRS